MSSGVRARRFHPALPGHTFPEQGGAWRTPKDTKAAAFEFSRTLAEPSEPSRTPADTVRDRASLVTKKTRGDVGDTPRKSAFLREQLGNSRGRSGRVIGCRFVFARKN